MPRLAVLFLALVIGGGTAGAQEPKPDEPAPGLPGVEEHVTVSATRTDKRLEDTPTRVEVLGREEIEEKMLMTPGDIVMMLNEMGGLRVQATSPSLGAASVRIQGMRGRYTRVLSDGLPLFGEQVGSIGLLQIPPMDLGQVEVIKGAASALYGGGAMGGVINLVSRRPAPVPERELLLNRSTRGGTDAVFWQSGPIRDGWSGSFLAGGHLQSATDVDDDRWADLPGYARALVRPRLFWSDDRGRQLFATAGITWEERAGGTHDGVPFQLGDHGYVEALDTLRVDGGIVAQTLIRGRFVGTARAAFTSQAHRHRFGDVLERDDHRTAFGEVAVRGGAGRHTWVAGAAIEHDTFRPRDVPQFAYTFTTPGLFIQDDVAIAPWLAVTASGRLDAHSEYGAFFSPRGSALLRQGPWSTRLSAGAGFYAPTALTEETEAAGLTPLTIPHTLVAERGRSLSFDLTRAFGPSAATVTLFRSRVERAIRVERSPALILGNADEPVVNTGVELLGTFRAAPLALTASYTYVRARETDAGARVDVPLTPRHSAGVVGMIEREDVGRLGVEVYYTGVQRLDANPYAVASEPYWIVGLLGERQLGRVRVFVNGENLTNMRQTRVGPLVRPSRAPDGRWTVDAWAPLEGRSVNAGVRLSF